MAWCFVGFISESPWFCFLFFGLPSYMTIIIHIQQSSWKSILCMRLFFLFFINTKEGLQQQLHNNAMIINANKITYDHTLNANEKKNNKYDSVWTWIHFQWSDFGWNTQHTHYCKFSWECVYFINTLSYVYTYDIYINIKW